MVTNDASDFRQFSILMSLSLTRMKCNTSVLLPWLIQMPCLTDLCLNAMLYDSILSDLHAVVPLPRIPPNERGTPKLLFCLDLLARHAGCLMSSTYGSLFLYCLTAISWAGYQSLSLIARDGSVRFSNMSTGLPFTIVIQDNIWYSTVNLSIFWAQTTIDSTQSSNEYPPLLFFRTAVLL